MSHSGLIGGGQGQMLNSVFQDRYLPLDLTGCHLRSGVSAVNPQPQIRRLVKAGSKRRTTLWVLASLPSSERRCLAARQSTQVGQRELFELAFAILIEAARTMLERSTFRHRIR